MLLDKHSNFVQHRFSANDQQNQSHPLFNSLTVAISELFIPN